MVVDWLWEGVAVRKPVLSVLLAVIVLSQLCFLAGLFVAFDVGPMIKSSVYILLHGQAVDNPDDELVVIQDIFGRYGYMDNKGIVRIWPRYRYADDFSEGLAEASTGKKTGYIDKSGIFVIKEQYDYCRSFNSGVAEVGWFKEGSVEKTFINRNGDVVAIGKKHVSNLITGQQLPESDDMILVSDGSLHGYRFVWQNADSAAIFQRNRFLSWGSAGV